MQTLNEEQKKNNDKKEQKKHIAQLKWREKGANISY